MAKTDEIWHRRKSSPPSIIRRCALFAKFGMKTVLRPAGCAAAKDGHRSHRIGPGFLIIGTYALLSEQRFPNLALSSATNSTGRRGTKSRFGRQFQTPQPEFPRPRIRLGSNVAPKLATVGHAYPGRWRLFYTAISTFILDERSPGRKDVKRIALGGYAPPHCAFVRSRPPKGIGHTLSARCG